MTAANERFGMLVRAEWTKLRSVRRWKLGLALGLVLTGLFAALIGSGSSTNVNDFPGGTGDDDIVRNSLVGVVFGLVTVVTLAVLFMTSEYKQGMMIRTTLAASPRRGRVLAAKAIVIGTLGFVAGLVASAAAFLIAQPLLRDNGFEPPGYPYLSLSDGPVLRAVVGTALAVALLAVLSLGLATIFRRSTGPISLVVLVVVLPQILSPALPVAAARFLGRVTPVAGFAVQHTRERLDTVIEPWVGLGVLAAWTAATVLFAALLFRFRDA